MVFILHILITSIYQLPLISTTLLQADLINVCYLTACVFIRSWWRWTFWMALPMKSIITPKLLVWRVNQNRTPGLRLLVSSLPGSIKRKHVESLGKPHISTRAIEALSGKLDINRHSASILYLEGIDLTLKNNTICLKWS